MKIPTTRQVGTLDSAGRGAVVCEPIPDLGEGSVLVKVHASSISPGSELGRARAFRDQPDASPTDPRVFGYQNAGVVLEVGSTVKRFKAGDRVACMGGDYALHANYAVVPQNLCAHLPENVSFEEGALIHLVSTAVHAIRRVEPQIGEHLLVVGLGIVGQLVARMGQIAGMFIMGWDTMPIRCELARKWGIDQAVLVGQDDEIEAGRNFTRGAGFDTSMLVFGGDGTDTIERIKQVMKLSPDGHNMGKVGIVGGVMANIQWGQRMGNLDVRSCARTGPGYHDEHWETSAEDYPPVFMRWTTRTNMDYVMRLMSEKKLDVKSLITHRFPLARIDDAVGVHVDQPDSTLATILIMEHED